MTQGIGYYLDALGEWVNTPAGSVIIGNEKGTTFQDPINNDGRLFGFSAALNAQGAELWEAIKGEADPTAILDAAFNKDQGKSSVLKGRGDSSKWFYAQNFQVTDIKSATAMPNEVYAGVAAVLWSFDQLYPSIEAIPAFDSYYVKSLGDYDASQIQKLLSPIFKLEVANAPGREQWNFLSTLHDNGLINGFIGDIYALGKEGKFPVDAKPFRASVPYALQSTWVNLPFEGGVITTDYDGSLPVNGSVYFPDSVPKNFAGSDYLRPNNRPLPISFSPPTQSPATVQSPEVVQIADDLERPSDVVGFTQYTDADDILEGQSNFRLLMMGGNDYLDVVGGVNNFANGNRGDDSFLLQNGSGEYLGGKGNDQFEVIGGIDNFVNGDLGDDSIVVRGGSGGYLGGGGNDFIEVLSAEEGTSVNGNIGNDFITGDVNGVIYRGGKNNDTIVIRQGEAWGDLGIDVFIGVNGDGYAVINDYTPGEDFIELPMDGLWSNLSSGLMFTDDSGDQIMLLVGVNEVEQLTLL